MSVADKANGGSVYDCIVVGAGHNGLVCAAYLARAGRSVLILEAAAQVGGAAVTREFAPGFHVSGCAHLLHQMPARLIDDLGLESHGLRFACTRMPTVAYDAGSGQAVQMLGDALTGTLPVPAGDVDAYAGFVARMGRFARTLAPVLDRVPPRLGTTDWADRTALLKLGLALRRLGRRDMRELLRIGGMNVFDLLNEQFESPLLKGALGLDAVLGTGFGPRSPGTVLTLLYRLAAQAETGPRSLAQPVGGMGAVCDALSRAATAAGVTIRTQARVARVLVNDDAACGVQLQSGERIVARAVISNADPQTTLLGLLGAEHLDTGFVRRVSHLRTRGLAAKLHLALDSAPRFGDALAAQAGARVLIAPSLEYVERAFNHSKYGECSAAPALEITVPTSTDASLAPPGQHVLSAIVQYAPYEVRTGWEAERGRLADAVVDLLDRHAPGLRRSVIAVELLTPADIEREYRIAGGHWHHAELAFDQFFMLRPVPGAAQYRTPLPGLFLCGAGAHPGGGVMGRAGRLAAAQVLAQVA
jgi:phytoene dehydrogenase-like protein